MTAKAMALLFQRARGAVASARNPPLCVVPAASVVSPTASAVTAPNTRTIAIKHSVFFASGNSRCTVISRGFAEGAPIMRADNGNVELATFALG